MMSIPSLADNMELPGRCGDWLAPPPSPPRAQSSARHDERGGGDFYMATSGDLTWPPVGTFSWPRTEVRLVPEAYDRMAKATARGVLAVVTLLVLAHNVQRVQNMLCLSSV